MKSLTRSTVATFLLSALGAGSLAFTGSAVSAASYVSAVNLGSASRFAVLAPIYITTGAPSVFHGNIGTDGAVTTGANNAINGSLFAGQGITTGAANTVSGNLYAGAAITNGAGTSISGNQNLSPGASYSDAATVYSSAISAMNIAKADLSSRTAVAITSVLGGQTLTPGVYSSATNLDLTGNITLNAQGNQDAVFIIRTVGYLVTAAGSTVTLSNGAQAKNVYWSSTGYTTTGADSLFNGTIFATSYISVGAHTKINGRIFSQTSYVVFGVGNSNSVYGLDGIGNTELSTTGTVPSVLGYSEEEARSRLSNAGFTTGTVTTTPVNATSQNNGQVASQSNVGSPNQFDSPINVVLFAYSAPTPSVTIPSASVTALGAIGATPTGIAKSPSVQTPQLSLLNSVFYFTSDSAVLSVAAKKKIKAMTLALRTMKQPGTQLLVTVIGSVTPTRSKAADNRLANARANVVIAALKKGAPGTYFKKVLVRGKNMNPKNRNSSVALVSATL